jgi:hypothetical protein
VALELSLVRSSLNTFLLRFRSFSLLIRAASRPLLNVLCSVNLVASSIIVFISLSTFFLSCSSNTLLTDSLTKAQIFCYSLGSNANLPELLVLGQLVGSSCYCSYLASKTRRMTLELRGWQLVFDQPLAIFDGLKALTYAGQKRRKKSRLVTLDRPCDCCKKASSC